MGYYHLNLDVTKENWLAAGFFGGLSCYATFSNVCLQMVYVADGVGKFTAVPA